MLFSEGNNQLTLYVIPSAASRSYEGNSPAHAASAPAFAFLSRDGDVTTVKVASASAGWNPVTVVRSDRPLRAPAMSPNGQSVTFQVMPEDNWEVAVVGADGTGERLLSSEIQHDRFPRFISNDIVLAAKGEGRHQRSYLYEINTGEEIKLFHNNTVRTIAPEYEWASSADATKVLVVAERDGDTVSPERGVYLVHLDRTVSQENVVQRLESSLAAERDLRARGAAMFAPIHGEIRSLTESVSGSDRLRQRYERPVDRLRAAQEHVACDRWKVVPDVAADEAAAGHVLQRKRQGAGGDPRQGAAQLSEAPRAVAQRQGHGHRPFPKGDRLNVKPPHRCQEAARTRGQGGPFGGQQVLRPHGVAVARVALDPPLGHQGVKGRAQRLAAHPEPLVECDELRAAAGPQLAEDRDRPSPVEQADEAVEGVHFGMSTVDTDLVLVYK